MLKCYVVEPTGQDFVKLALKIMLWKRFGEAWRSLGGAPEGAWRRFWGSWEVLGGLLVSGCRFVKKCEVFDPKLGSMLGQKKMFFDVENWKMGFQEALRKKYDFGAIF